MIFDAAKNRIYRFDYEWEKKTVKSRYFTRLLDIKQTCIDTQMFLGQNHNRYEHSIGTCFEIKDVVNQDSFEKISEKDKQKVIFSGLIHDVGHGPFSHILEMFILPNIGIYDFHHEAMTIKIAEKIYETFSNPIFDFKNMDEIIQNGGKDLKNEVFHLVSNKQFGIDCDRIDYLIRDSFYSGIDLKVNFNKIKSGIFLTEEYNKIGKEFCLGINSDLIQDFHDFIEARYYMFENVYCNPVLSNINFLRADIIRESEPYLNLRSKINDLQEFVKLNDSVLQRACSFKKKSPILRSLAKRLENNDLYEFCLKFSVNNDNLKDMNLKQLNQMADHYKNLIFDVNYSQQFNIHSDLIVWAKGINNYKDLKLEDILIKDFTTNSFYDYKDYTKKFKIDRIKFKEKITFMVYTKKHNVLEIQDAFYKFKNHNNSLINSWRRDNIDLEENLKKLLKI